MLIVRMFRFRIGVIAVAIVLIASVAFGVNCVDRCLESTLHANNGGVDGYKYNVAGCNENVESCLGTSPACTTNASCHIKWAIPPGPGFPFGLPDTDLEHYCQWMNWRCDNPAQNYVEGSTVDLNCEDVTRQVVAKRCIKNG
jgi:hypothetical protein